MRDPDELAAVIDEAHCAGRLLNAAHHPVDALDDAYAIQTALTERRLARGGRIVGWKLGYTSLAMREQMGVGEPNFGPLLDGMLLGSGSDLGGRATQPKVEPEIAIRFGRAVAGGADRAEVLASIETVVACLEVVDSVWDGYRFTLAHNTADGSSAAFVIVGETLPLDRPLPDVSVAMLRNGEVVAEATGAAASGHPADGVVWLAAQLGARGRRIEAGDLVITGGLTAAAPLLPGDVIAAQFDGHQAVSVRRT